MNVIEYCPFCGNAVAPVLSNSNELTAGDCKEDSPYYTVVCAMVEDAPLPIANWKKGCGASGGFYPTPEEAIAAWNRRAREWISTEWETPTDIGERVLIYPINGNVERAVYLGGGAYGVHNYAVLGEDFAYWRPLPAPPMEDEAND